MPSGAQTGEGEGGGQDARLTAGRESPAAEPSGAPQSPRASSMAPIGAPTVCAPPPVGDGRQSARGETPSEHGAEASAGAGNKELAGGQAVGGSIALNAAPEVNQPALQSPSHPSPSGFDWLSVLPPQRPYLFQNHSTNQGPFDLSYLKLLNSLLPEMEQGASGIVRNTTVEPAPTIKTEPESDVIPHLLHGMADAQPPSPLAMAEEPASLIEKIKEEQNEPEGPESLSAPTAADGKASQFVKAAARSYLATELDKERDKLSVLELKQLALHEKLKLFKNLAENYGKGNVTPHRPRKRARMATNEDGGLEVKREEVETAVMLSHPEPAEPPGVREAVDRAIENSKREIMKQAKEIEEQKRLISALKQLEAAAAPACIDLTGDDD
jgi:hypothetical protein